jgi:ubiquitin-protein ligase
MASLSVTQLSHSCILFISFFSNTMRMAIVWFGVLFVHKGFYRSGVFKFRINIPESYPNAPPTVTFLTDMFHPLVDTQGRLSIAQQFPVWRPHQDYIFHILHYIKNAYKRVVLDGLVEKYCPNKEAYRLYVSSEPVFPYIVLFMPCNLL